VSTRRGSGSAAEPDAAGRWWGERWVGLLDGLGAGDARRVARGRALARRGAVEDLQVAPGRITALVAEDRVSPEQVEVTWPVPSDETWAAASAALADQLRFTAALLDGDLPADVEDILAPAGLRLLPRLADLTTRCSCAEPSDWCRHVAAVHVAAGLLLDRDPAVLLRLRGRERDELLRAMRADAGGTAAPPVTVDLSRGLAAPHGDLEAVPLHPMPVEDPAALFHHLGEPPGVTDDRPIVRLIERAAEGAWRLAAGAGAAAADEELLLAELRAQRVATAATLAQALGRDEDEVREQLDQLFAQGAVLRTGSGDRARYRAAAT
jgi:uncharacterized Zn finger protein